MSSSELTPIDRDVIPVDLNSWKNLDSLTKDIEITNRWKIKHQIDTIKSSTFYQKILILSHYYNKRIQLIHKRDYETSSYKISKSYKLLTL